MMVLSELSRRLPGETWPQYRERRAAAGFAPSSPSYPPIDRVRMIATDWVTDEHGNRSRQLRGV